MAAKRRPDRMHQFSSVGKSLPKSLNAYTVHEHELDIIAAGSQATLAVNLAIALVSPGVAFILTLTTTKIESDRLFYGYLIACINCLLAGAIMFAYWLKTRVSVHVTVARIKARLVVSPAIQDRPMTDPPGSKPL